MARAYKKTYLNSAMRNLAVMMDCGVRKYGYLIEDFYEKFLASEVSRQFANGNPRYLVGLSGAELADTVVEASGGTVLPENDEDTLDMLSRKSYTIVGLIRSPRYISFERGSTSLGSGSLEGFVMLCRDGFSSEAYHEMLLWCDLPGEIYSGEYNAARDRMKDDVETELNRLGRRRYKELRMDAEAELLDAQKEIDDGWAELAESTADAEKEWRFVREMPPDENGLTNEWYRVSREDFTEKALPQMIAFAEIGRASCRERVFLTV